MAYKVCIGGLSIIGNALMVYKVNTVVGFNSITFFL